LRSRKPGRVTLEGHSDEVWGAAFSRDGKRLASVSEDKTVKFWGAATGQETLTLHGHTGPVWGVAFSADGQRIATASGDETVKIWDVRPRSDAEHRLENAVMTFNLSTGPRTTRQRLGLR
jgi:WD40 repeat protein